MLSYSGVIYYDKPYNCGSKQKQMQYYRQKAKQQSFVAVFFFFQIVIQTYSQTPSVTPEVELVEQICTMLMRPL